MRIREIEPLHEEIYRVLRSSDVVKDKAEFGRDYFGRSRNYMHVLAHGHLAPSADAYRRLRDRLSILAKESQSSETGKVAAGFIRRLDEWLSRC